jgi:hypothetical protein
MNTMIQFIVSFFRLILLSGVMMLLSSTDGFAQGNSGGGALCLYQDSAGVIICTNYGNSGVGSENDCAAAARASNPICGMNPTAINIEAGGCASQIFGSVNSCLSLIPPHNLISVSPMNQTNCEAAGGRWCPSSYYGFFNGNSACSDIICATAIGLLPIDLIDLIGFYNNGDNFVTWSTESESNNDFFIVSHSTDGIIWNSLAEIPGAGNSSTPLSYRFIEKNPQETINYYKLIQVDYDGTTAEYGPISIDNRKNKRNLVRITNMMGQAVNENYSGIVIYHYDDGTYEKIYK